MTTMATLEDIVARIGVKMEEVAEAQRRTEVSMEQSQKKLSEAMAEMTRRMGGFDNRLGEIVEMIIIPGVRKKMNELGYNFPVASPNKKFSNADNSDLAEVDLMLENGKEVMVVEIKVQVNVWGVNRHLERLAKLRKNEERTGVTGKTMYAAVAGMSFDEDARVLAINSGMYVIEVDEKKERIKIESPAKTGAW